MRSEPVLSTALLGIALLAGCTGGGGENAQGSEVPTPSHMLAAIQADARLSGEWDVQAACNAARARDLEVVQCDEYGLTARLGGSSLSVRVLDDHILYSETIEEVEPGYYATQAEAHAAAAERWKALRADFESALEVFTDKAGLARAGGTEWRPVIATSTG